MSSMPSSWRRNSDCMALHRAGSTPARVGESANMSRSLRKTENFITPLQCRFDRPGGTMSTLIIGAAVALAYFALGELSSALAYAPTDAWTVWLASGLTLGLLLATGRARWGAVLGGAATGAAIFALVVGGTAGDALGYAAIEIAAGVAGAWVATRVAGTALRFESPRELGA